MDIVISAVASELVSRFISFLSKQYRYSNKANVNENLEMLQRLLVRAHTIVEEAEGRYVSNSRMLAQLKTLTEAMYRGYQVLDTYLPLEKLGETAEEVSDFYNHTWWPPFAAGTSQRRRQLTDDTARSTTAAALSSLRHQVESAVRNLETTVASMTEFVVLLTGCERMSRSPYSSYLYIDNFMFGRQVEKQQAIHILTMKEHDDLSASGHPTTVLPIIGGCRVGKKTLVGSICSDDRIRSHYPCILHFSGDEIQRIDGENFRFRQQVRTLVTVEFAFDVTDEEWLSFHSWVAASTGRGSKVIIISRLEKLARFGTVSPIKISSLSQEEYSYLFKVLAFGSADPADHPRLALLGRELATLFRGSLVMMNVYASVLRTSLSVRLWTRVLDLFRAMTRENLATFGEHPKTLLERDGSEVDITGLSPQSGASLSSFRLVLLTTTGKKKSASSDSGLLLPKMSFGDIVAGARVLPDEFQLVWESRLPPYTVICANCAAEKNPQRPVSPRNKRPRLCMAP